MSGGKFAECRQTSRVALDRDNAARTRGEQCPGQTAGTGADLDDCSMIEPPSGAGDSASEVEVEEEILAEALARDDAVSRDHLAQLLPEDVRVWTRDELLGGERRHWVWGTPLGKIFVAGA